jgi:hypothetical protein
MWVVVWLIAAKLHSHHPGHFRPYPVRERMYAPLGLASETYGVRYPYLEAGGLKIYRLAL